MFTVWLMRFPETEKPTSDSECEECYLLCKHTSSQVSSEGERRTRGKKQG